MREPAPKPTMRNGVHNIIQWRNYAYQQNTRTARKAFSTAKPFLECPHVRLRKSGSVKQILQPETYMEAVRLY